MVNFVDAFLFCNLKRTLQGNNTVKYQFVFCRILVVYTEEALAYELEAVKCFRRFDTWFDVALSNFQRIWIDIHAHDEYH